MCLLDEVIDWDAHSITCLARNHMILAHPLRWRDRLPVTAGIEYAAQGMAVHGALLGGARGQTGYLASVRNVRFHAERLDDVGAELEIRCQRLHGDASSVLYAFTLRAGERALLEGRAAVVLDASAFANRLS